MRSRLAIFAGSFTVLAALAILGGDELEGTPLSLVSALVAKSLITRTENRSGGSIFRMLQVIRDYALRRLEADPDAPELYRRHARPPRRHPGRGLRGQGLEGVGSQSQIPKTEPRKPRT